MSSSTQVAQTSSVVASIGDDGAFNVHLPAQLSSVWIDRDLSWLQFNQRVLAEALDERTPLLERAKFLAIFTANLDEFFMKRMAVLHESNSPDKAHLLQQLMDELLPSLEAQAKCFREQIVPGLAEHRVHLRHWQELTESQKATAQAFFDSEVSAALTPLIIDSAENFPFLSHLSTSLVFPIEDSEIAQQMYARVKVPTGLKQWVQLPAAKDSDELIFVRLHEVIEQNLSKLYPGMQIGPVALVRLTREAEVGENGAESASVKEQVLEQVKKRRFQPVVRLEFTRDVAPEIKDLLRQHFQLESASVYELPGELDYTTLFELMGVTIPGIKDEPWTPLTPAALAGSHNDIFGVIRSGDFLVHHPYESFEASVEHFVEAAANDPQVVAVKMTVYRVGDDTPFVRSLIRAAETGKQVVCVIELKARFDEERNLHWAAALEKAGAHVTYGVKGLKIHGKTALVVRKEKNGLRSYAHIGTGNYHARTARLYADFGLFTCDPAITSDVVALFHHLTGHSRLPEPKVLLIAPNTMRSRFLEMIQREISNKRAGKPARIIGKMNQLEDPEIIAGLCEASRAGVPVDLIIRGFCCLKPGVAGETENIRVRSIIGRFLEHSRVYHFANGKDRMADGEFYIGSADWMHRNLSKRIEIVTPVNVALGKQRLAEFLDICLNDTRQAWQLGADGEYRRVDEHSEQQGTHKQLMAIQRGA
jgi:polyphosphate kinase